MDDLCRGYVRGPQGRPDLSRHQVHASSPPPLASPAVQRSTIDTRTRVSQKQDPPICLIVLSPHGG